jgi:holliday junction DNA helicase RuvB
VVRRIVDSNNDDEEKQDAYSLRPKSLEQFIGQDKVKNNLATFLTAAKKRDPSKLKADEGILDHILFHGPPGLGKTTLAIIIANEMGVPVKRTTGKAIERSGDIASILTGLSEGSVLFMDEIHRLNPQIEESIYGAMEDFRFDIITGQGPSARTITIPLKRFTLIGATTRPSLLSAPLRDRFGIVERLELYKPSDLAHIVICAGKALGVVIDEETAFKLACRGRGTPRIALRLLRRARDFAQVKGTDIIDSVTLDETLSALEINEFGLDKMDRRLIKTIAKRFHGGPVGVDTMSAILGEDRNTIIDVIEPYLLQENMIMRTPRGRVLLDDGYKACGLKPPTKYEEGEYLF